MDDKFTEFYISHSFPVAPEIIYKAWLNSDRHSAMTGGKADCNAQEGKSFTAWYGYISGTNITLVQNHKIIQSWRTTEFSSADEDSLVEIELQKSDHGCLFELHHSRIPAGQPDYKKGWLEFYIEPMIKYFK
jgi:activator of HSP90 ATPase